MKKLFFLCIGLLATIAAVVQNVGIGTLTSNAKLNVSGTHKIADGSKGTSNILTSNAIGLASLQPHPPQPPSPHIPPSMNYPVVWICCNPWMTKNLDVDTYRNGDPIPNVTGHAEWAALTTGAYCYYNNNEITYGATYGKLYNWYAVNDPRGLAPQGWHIPTEWEWSTLITCIGTTSAVGGPMKEIGTTHWNAPNTAATNGTGFTGLPGGSRRFNGMFLHVGNKGYWWSATEDSTATVLSRNLLYNSKDINVVFNDKRLGLSVRCVKD